MLKVKELSKRGLDDVRIMHDREKLLFGECEQGAARALCMLCVCWASLSLNTVCKARRSGSRLPRFGCHVSGPDGRESGLGAAVILQQLQRITGYGGKDGFG